MLSKAFNNHAFFCPDKAPYSAILTQLSPVFKYLSISLRNGVHAPMLIRAAHEYRSMAGYGVLYMCVRTSSLIELKVVCWRWAVGSPSTTRRVSSLYSYRPWPIALFNPYRVIHRVCVGCMCTSNVSVSWCVTTYVTQRYPILYKTSYSPLLFKLRIMCPPR